MQDVFLLVIALRRLNPLHLHRLQSKILLGRVRVRFLRASLKDSFTRAELLVVLLALLMKHVDLLLVLDQLILQLR